MRARDLKAQMTERRVVRKNVTKQMVYARMAARAVGQVKEKEEGDGVLATSKYCTKVIEDDEDDEEENKQPGKQKLSPLLYVARHGEPRHGGPNLRQRTQFCIFFTMCSPPALASASPTLHGPEYDSVSIKEQGKQDEDGEGEP
jgi:hypothetical protein